MEGKLEIKKRDKFYYARILPQCNVYDVLEVIVRGVYSDCLVCIEKRDNQAFLFWFSDVNKIVFDKRDAALTKVLNAEKQQL